MSKKEQVIQELNRVISLIHTDIQAISPAEKRQMVEETVEHFNHYVSPGWLAYRKSVSSDSEAGAVLEWQDEGAYCYGLNGEQFIDCLGGFGIYTCGHRNPEILDVVKAQLDHQALHSQELLDPLRGYLAKAMADITPGELQYCFFTNGGAEAGYVAKVSASGSQGTITMMVGIDANGAITGISVVNSSETSGIGTKVVGNEPNSAGVPVLDQFIGMSGAGSLVVGKTVTPISGATVSTKGITMGANAALAAVEAMG